MAKYTTQPWSCRGWDEDDCCAAVVDNLREQFNTVYDVAFLPGADGLLAAGYHSGDVRVFNWKRVCASWLGSKGQAGAELSWRGHDGPVYALALLESAELGALFATAGDDGWVRVWRVADIVAAAAAATAEGGQQDSAGGAPPPPVAGAVRLPHVQNPLGVSEGSQPAAQALAADPATAQLFAGGSDGGVHVLDVRRLLAAGRDAAAASGALSSLPGHAAAVLALDLCPATSQLASGSEDGTVRVWEPAARRCVAIINPWEERTVPPGQPLELLRCVKGSPVTCVKWGSGGQWLVLGNAAGSLTLWNAVSNELARHKSTSACIPQALLLSPGAVLMAGTDRKVHQYSFQLEEVHSFDVGAESAFAVRADPGGSGMLAVAGARGCVDLLSAQGAVLGLVRPPPSALLAPSACPCDTSRCCCRCASCRPGMLLRSARQGSLIRSLLLLRSPLQGSVRSPVRRSSGVMTKAKLSQGELVAAQLRRSPVPLIDVGVNLVDGAFDKDRDTVIARAREAGVAAIVVTGCTVASARAARALCEAEAGYPLYFTAGVHPHNAKDCDGATLDALRDLACHPRCVAIGECGLDFNRNFSPPDVQERWFEAQVALALELRKPLFMHCRDAGARFAEILRGADVGGPAGVRGVLHCFTGNGDELAACLDLGLCIGITGITPSKARPSRNEPALLPHVLSAVAAALGQDEAAVAARTSAVARAFFGLPDADAGGGGP
ncbi:tatD [Scenedesmus sp. PABB004]|nr:tatD [Scenedesmus sp. PABB004]